MSDPAIAVIDMVRAMPKAAGFSPRSFGASAAAPPSNDQPIAEAFAAGFDEGQRVAAEAARADREALLALISRAEALQPEPNEELAVMIGETVFRLVQEIVGASMIGKELLEQRIEQAVDLIVEADSGRCLFLHPDDLALLEGSNLPLTLMPDPLLARGDLRIECSQGWIEHGPSFALQALRKQLGLSGERP